MVLGTVNDPPGAVVGSGAEVVRVVVGAARCDAFAHALKTVSAAATPPALRRKARRSIACRRAAASTSASVAAATSSSGGPGGAGTNSPLVSGPPPNGSTASSVTHDRRFGAPDGSPVMQSAAATRRGADDACGRCRRSLRFVRVRVAVAVVLLVVGVVWIGQGIGLIRGSFMTGQAVWGVIGAFAVFTALTMLRRAARDRRRHRDQG